MFALVFLALISRSLSQTNSTVGPSSSNCPSDYFTGGEGLWCYAYVQTSDTFGNAEKTCRENGGQIAEIKSAEEDAFIRSLIAQDDGSIADTWIGLLDQDIQANNFEGRFYWLSNPKNILSSDSYTNWAPDEPEASNRESRDCVVYTTTGWRVGSSGCESAKRPFLCQVQACTAVDCNTGAFVGGDGSNSAGLIAGIIVAIVLIAVVIIVLWYVYKFHNDVWQKYLCCCCLPSKVGIEKLEQENQRLRRELSLRRTASQTQRGDSFRQTSFTSNRFPAISPEFHPSDASPAIPDGQGGMLPSIKPQASPRMSRSYEGSPPPIPALKRQTSGASGRTSSTGGMVTIPGMPRPVRRPESVSGPSRGPLPPFMAPTLVTTRNSDPIKEEQETN